MPTSDEFKPISESFCKSTHSVLENSMSSLAGDFKKIDGKIDVIYKYVFIGNGKSSMDTRINLLEDWMKSSKGYRMAIILTAISSAVSICAACITIGGLVNQLEINTQQIQEIRSN